MNGIVFTRMSNGISPLQIRRKGKVYCFVGRTEKVERWEKVGEGAYYVGRGEERYLEIEGDVIVKGRGRVWLRGEGIVRLEGGIDVVIEDGSEIMVKE